tara:strand:+ start:12774 stop:14630 length:1857 start_codon:yes stop_codon:yes gene_type:complete
MELLYVWIEDYKNIKKQGFNFSPKHWFDYDEKTNTIKHEDRNPNYPNNFFGENISNVTAIVGKNGSGKSGILNSIIDIFTNIQHTNQSIKIILITSRPTADTRFKYNKNIGSDKGIKIISNLDNLSLEGNSITRIPIINFGSEILKQFQLIPKIFYYSNVWDLHSINAAEEFDLIDEQKEKIPESISTSSIFKRFNDLYGFKNQEYSAFIDLIASKKCQKANLKIPNFIKFNLCEFSSRDDVFVDKDNYPEFSFYEIDKDLYHQKKWDIYITYRVFFALCNHIIKNAELDAEIITIKRLVAEFIRDYHSSSNEARNRLAVKWIHSFKEYENASDIQLYGSKSALKYIEQLQKLFNSNDYPCYIDIINETDRVKQKLDFIFNATEGEKPFNSEFYKLLDINFVSENNNKNNHQLSTGELALYFILSRFNTIIQHRQNTKVDHYLFLIDEGELGFHPQWQKEYLNILIEELPKLTDKKIQIICTSHSPFLVSDLPKENIIFLNKDKNGLCEVKSPKDMTHTFGANIHSLYRHSFFLENGLMGEFAKGKIDGVIQDINQDDANNKVSDIRKDEILFIINQIGEPLIQSKLKQKYKDVFLPVEDQINELKLELEKLEASRKN